MRPKAGRLLRNSWLGLTVLLPALEAPVLSEEAPAFEEALQSGEEDVLDAFGKLRVHLIVVPLWAVGVRPGTQERLYQKVIEGLDRPEFFRIYDGGQERVIAWIWREEDAPVRLAILWETSSQTRVADGFFRLYLQELLEGELRPQDGYALATFGDALTLLKDFQEPNPKAETLLGSRRYSGKSGRFRDAVAAMLEKTASQTGIAKRILLVIAAETEVSKDPSATGFADLYNLAKKSNTQVVLLAVREGDKSRSWGAEPLASLTGGMAFTLHKDKLGPPYDARAIHAAQDLRSQIRDIYASIKREILIGYYLRKEEVVPGSWRQIEIRLSDDSTVWTETERIRKKAGAKEILLGYPRQSYIP